MPCDLDETLFAQWQAVFASRIGRPQMDLAQQADYKAFCRVFDSDEDFHAAAQHVYERWQSWDAWPAPIEFESARATLRRIPDAEIKQTYAQYIAPSRQIAPPKSDALDAFAADWRAALRQASADPEAVRLERSAAKLRPNDGREWASLPGVPGPKVARGSDSRVAGPPPGPSIDAIAAGGAAA